MEYLHNITRYFYATLSRRLSGYCPLIQVISGPRQVGKTTAVKQFLSANPDRATYLSFDNPGQDPISQLRFEWERAAKRTGQPVLILDEIQNVDGWASVVKELFDRDRSQRSLSLVVLGSSSLDILVRGEESLLGRFEIIRAPHWNLNEMSKYAGWDLTQFLQFGGYPVIAEMFNNDSSEAMARVQRFVRDSIIEPVLTRDILSLRPVLNTALLRQVLTISLSLPCEEISFSKFAGQLSERGSAVTIKRYLELLEKAFLLKLLPRYSRGVVRKRTSSPKIVPLAPALVHAFKDPLLVQNDSTWFGHLFEMAVISRLSELPFELYYWSNSREDVDLVLDDGTQPVAVAIRSNERSEWRGLRAFKRMYPDAALAQVDRGTGEQLLRAESPMDYLKEIIIPSTAEIWRS